MRVLFSLVLALSLVGCNVESKSSFESTVTNPDGSTTTTKTEKKTTNGVTTETKTETTTATDGKKTVVTYQKKGNDWVKQ